MKTDIKINNTTLKAIKDDITNLDIESFVFYARTDLKLGSGYGNAISTRGGPKIKEELDKIGSIEKTEAVVSAAGMLKAKYIIHAAGPMFSEENTESKLHNTMINALKEAQKKGIKKVAFPLMGIGFYGIPPTQSLSIMTDAIKDFVKGNDAFEEIIICANDNREYLELEKKFKSLN